MQNDRPVPQYPIEGVDRTLRLLTLFKEEPELQLADVRDRLEIGQSTAHRLMAMLVYRGFAVQDPRTRTYRAGPELLEIGLSVVNSFDLRTIARPVLEELADRCGETVHLGVLEGGLVRYVDCIESPALLRVGGRVGLTTPAYASSLGKAILATLDDDAVRAVFPHEDLPPVTDRTIRSRAALLAELDQIRRRGYARNREEVEPGVTSVAMAVNPPGRRTSAAMSIAAPVSRSSRERERDHTQLLTEATTRLAQLF